MHRTEPIEFLSLLSEDAEPSGSSYGGDAHVFKMRVGTELYALKIVGSCHRRWLLLRADSLQQFKFFKLEEARINVFEFANRLIDDETFTYQTDPFFAECRAYGRIQVIQQQRQQAVQNKRRGHRAEQKEGAQPKKPKERSRRGHLQDAVLRSVQDIAVPCHGYMSVPSDPYEEMFRIKFGVANWSRPASEKGRPFRALVKQYADDSRAIRSPKKMLNDLKTLRANGIFQRDVYARNYIGGLLVDFSIAWTEPHWALTTLTDPNLTTRKVQELFQFNRMMEEARLKYRAIADNERKASLRKRTPA